MEQKGENVTVMVPVTQGYTEHYNTRYSTKFANCRWSAVRYTHTQAVHSKVPAPELP